MKAKNLVRLAVITSGLALILLSRFGPDGWALEPKGGAAAGLILEKSEGEHRTRRPRELSMPASAFMIKVDRRNGGSQKMWLGTEEIPPHGVIQRHRHLDQDEILLIQAGTAHVRLDTEDRDAHAGAVVFIPSGTWIGLENTGSENVSLAFVFSDPGFDDYLRCTSVVTGEASSKLTPDELRECQRQGRFEFEDARRLNSW